ncbi:hypothetical protein Scep_021689 [Stephania cephalantha]|uniref:Uncharacterized protein n=1 Tax=Stephania cephalantha TaxID=152367 RepID=A0AAP0F3W9_9MAGN
MFYRKQWKLLLHVLQWLLRRKNNVRKKLNQKKAHGTVGNKEVSLVLCIDGGTRWPSLVSSCSKELFAGFTALAPTLGALVPKNWSGRVSSCENRHRYVVGSLRFFASLGVLELDLQEAKWLEELLTSKNLNSKPLEKTTTKASLQLA